MSYRPTEHTTTLRLDLGTLHDSLSSPVSASMNFLNEVAQDYPDAVSFAAGRPFEGYFDVDDIHRYINAYRRHLTERFGGDEAKVRRTLLQYGRTKGIIHELIATHLEVDEGFVVDPESVVVTVGCQEALYLTLRALRSGPQDALVAVTPSYVGVHGAAQLVDMPLLPVAESAAGIDLDDLAAVVRRARGSGLRPRALYLVPDFANPTGVRMSREDRLRTLEAASELGLLVLEDNPYGLFGAPAGPPTMKALDTEGRVVYLGSFAKTGLPGARVGYAVADQRVTGPDGGAGLLADQLAKIKSMTTVNTSPIAQAVIGGKLLEHGHSLRAANERERETYLGNLRLMQEGLAARFGAGQVPGVAWNSPGGGFFLLLNVPFATSDELLERSAREHHVLWTPLHHFYADSEPRSVMRLSFSHLLPEEIDEGLDRLAGFVRKQAQGTA
ncbi:PLP-dependent aminotransferase family protein [Kitasatospora sp. RG8]|uniref:aminotransferase-like domain-containing protein n=1 Tax=Kitasatospora sp. RG8 TaxID=2820815 RepID=UPI001ADF058A|nr:PLP-dependent aminotransferase family protein [Kitasatospora sp. RG8]MBP0453543.1 PLP-dependent aminotransferase family protein [Kitasatospora sp. RG8]